MGDTHFLADLEERALGLPSVALGGHVLRAETAAVTAGALLGALRAGLAGTTTYQPVTEGG